MTSSLFPTPQAAHPLSVFWRPRPLLLSLDFDGTLAPIAPMPTQARVPRATGRLLLTLAQRPGTHLAFLSGRALSDLKKKVVLQGALYIGNHGLDFSPSSLGWNGEAKERWHHVSRRAREKLLPVLRRWPKALLEDKDLDLSLHYRTLPTGQVRPLLVEASRSLQGLPVVCRKGKKVLELRPQGAPSKAQALARLMARYHIRKKKGLCLHIGDDRTDEDVFRAFANQRNFIGIKVGAGKTLAQYRLRNTREVRRFLRLLTG